MAICDPVYFYAGLIERVKKNKHVRNYVFNKKKRDTSRLHLSGDKKQVMCKVVAGDVPFNGLWFKVSGSLIYRFDADGNQWVKANLDEKAAIQVANNFMLHQQVGLTRKMMKQGGVL